MVQETSKRYDDIEQLRRRFKEAGCAWSRLKNLPEQFVTAPWQSRLG